MGSASVTGRARCGDFYGNPAPMKKAALGAFLVCLTAPGTLFAAEPESGRGSDAFPSSDGPEDEEPALPPVPLKTDKVGGHFQVGAGGTLAQPFGNVAEDVRSRYRGGIGGGPQFDLGYGLDRFVFVGAYGEMQWLSEAQVCADCSGSTWGAGLFVRYHLVQGSRLDPWLSYGVGYRSLSSDSKGESLSYAGIEWMRLQFGATWFATPHLGLGPVIQLGAGTMTNRPTSEDAGGTNFRFQLGLRVALDFPGR